MNKLLAGIDVGTTGVRCMLFDSQGNLVSGAYREYETKYLRPGWAEQDLEQMISQTMLVCREALNVNNILAKNIASIGFSSQGHVTLAVDQNGQILRPLISWQDVRPQQEMDEISRIISPEEYYSITGMPLIPILIVTKINWIRKHEPDVYALTDKFVQHQDIILKAFGAESFLTDLPSTSFYGAWDVRSANWDTSLLERFDLNPAQFGQPTPSGTQVGTIPPGVAEQTGFAAGTPICVGAWDHTCGIIGMGSTLPGMATATLGTSGLAVLVVDQPITGKGGMLTSHHALPNLWQLMGGAISAASSYRWFRDTIGTLEVEQARQKGCNTFNLLNELAANAPPGSGGLLFLPYLNSSGTPHWNTQARAAFIGMSMAHGRAELTRAVMEGVALEMNDTMSGWYQSGMEIKSLRLGGGATKSPLWNQIQADVYGRPVQIMKVGESTVLGAAILGGVGAGVFDSIQEGVDAMVHVETEIEPIVENHEIYQGLYSAYVEANQALSRKTFENLAAIQDITSNRR